MVETPKIGRIIACLVVFNDLDLLPDCLASLEGTDLICVVDGAYKDFPHDKPWSTDGTIEYLRNLSKKDKRIRLIECNKAWENEVDKRNAYFVGEEGDWYLVVDSDERVGGATIDQNGIRALKKHLRRCQADALDVPVWAPGEGLYDFAPRLFRHRQGIQYKFTHYLVFFGNRIWLSHPTEKFEGLKLWHLPHLRDNERNSAKESRNKILAEEELRILEELIRKNSESSLTQNDIKIIEKIYQRHVALMKARGWL